MHIFYFSLVDVFRAGTVAGVYVGMEYGMERIRGTRDWVISNFSMMQLVIVGFLLFRFQTWT